MTKEELYWLAGYLEGEGWFGYRQINDDSISPRIGVSSVDPEPVEKVGRLLGCKLLGPYRASKINPNANDFYQVTLARRRKDVLELCKALYPLLSKRRQNQIDKLFEAARAFPPRYKKRANSEETLISSQTRPAAS